MSDPLKKHAETIAMYERLQINMPDIYGAGSNVEIIVDLAAALRAEREQAAKLREELERLRKVGGLRKR